MRTAARRQLGILETEELIYRQTYQTSLATTAFLCWKVVLAHYLGELKSDDEDPGEAEARALNYPSRYDYLQALFNGEIAEINRRFRDACCPLFAREGLDLNRSSPRVLSSAAVK